MIWTGRKRNSPNPGFWRFHTPASRDSLTGRPRYERAYHATARGRLLRGGRVRLLAGEHASQVRQATFVVPLPSVRAPRGYEVVYGLHNHRGEIRRRI